MNAADLVSRMRDLGVRLWAEGERLRYEAPAGAVTGEVRAELLRHKSELLAFLREARDAAQRDLPPLVPVDRTGELPLSFSQQRLWFLDQMEPGGTQYNIVRAFRLSGPLDVEAMRRALAEIVRRHEVLRTTFETSHGHPTQRVAAELPLEMVTESLAHLGLPSAEAEAKRRADREYREPFDLRTGPLLRARLLRLDDEEHVFVVAVHHIVADGWSLGVFYRELGTLYRAFAAGRPSPLAELPIQYADVAAWQRRWLQGERLTAHLDYWKERLADAPPLALTTDRPRPAVQTFAGARESLVLPPGLNQALGELSREPGATLFMTLLAAFLALLQRYTGQDDLVVGSPIANRSRPEIEGLIGFFVNTLVLRTDLSGDPSVRELLARVRDVALGAYRHQDLPFETLVQELHPERDPSRNPLFQVGFALQNAPAEPLELGDLTLSPVATDVVTTRFDLEAHIWEGPEGLTVWFVYNTDLFEGSTIRRMLGHYRRLLEQIVSDPDRRVPELPLLSEDERRRLLVEWNETASDYPRDATVHECFARQARRTLDRVAVRFGESALTYGELDRRANQLAHRLRKLGTGVDRPVAVLLDRSVEMVVAWLGILKAGGAYLPLDPSYPEQRLAAMLGDAQPPVLLTTTALRGRAPGYQGQVVCLDGGGHDWATELASDPIVDVSAAHLAYVMYTSGSTGQPKGITIPHRAILRLVCNTDYVQIQAEDRIAQASNASFDAATFEVWGALLHGAQLVGIPREVALEPRAFAGFLREGQVDVMFLTTALFNQMAREAPDAFRGLRALLFGGEAVDPASVRRVLRSGPPARLLHVYGPTESTTFATWQLVTEVPEGAGTVPIGSPIANTRLYVLDHSLQPVPVGVPGELYIGGDGLARGYLNRPELTAERFVPDPFGGAPGARLYKTGDTVRYREDGSVEFLGRVDHQVKVRGFRIELGEIEATLAAHPGVREAVVLAREDEPGDKRLVAYLVPAPGGEPPARELRSFLGAKLPEYMVPAAFVVLDALPLTPNGKVDRKALPAPDWSRPELESEFEAPRTGLERAVAAVWAEVLGLDRVGVHDNFFSLGGHSLLATQVISRLQEAFAVELPLNSLFQTPTVSGLAAEIARREGRGHPGARLPTLVPDPGARHQPFPLTEVQQAYWIGRGDFFELGQVATHIYFEVESRGLDLDRFHRAWRRLIERHDMLRAVISPDGEQRVLRRVPPYDIEVFDLRDADPATVRATLERVRESMSHQVLPTDRWPLFDIRASLLSEGRVRLHFSFDALIFDAWSMKILFEEWFRLYENPGRSLPDLQLSFRDYVLAEDALKGTELYERSRAYWWARLDGLPPGPQLPLARPPGSIARPHFAGRQSHLEPDTWLRLKRRARQAGLTPSGVALAAFAAALRHWTKSPRFTINLTLFNRLPLHAQVDEIVGDFTSLTLLEVHYPPEDSFEHLAQRLQQQLWEDLDHRYVSGVSVLRELARRRGGAPGPAMPVVFTSVLGQEKRADNPIRRDWQWEFVYGSSQTPQVWLDLGVSEDAGTLLLRLNSVEELFPDGLVDDLFDGYGRLLRSLADEESVWHEDWPQLAQRVLAPARRERPAAIDVAEAPEAQTLLQALFAEQVSRGPDRLAVIAPERSLRYGEVFRLSNRLGRRLRQLGARPNTLVGVLAEKGWEQVVGVLGVLASGAAYLPIDAGLPRERVAHLLADGQVELVVTPSRLGGALDGSPGVRRVCVDADDLAEVDDGPLEAVQKPDDLAYVIYTSGSTGSPKGVMIDHRGAVNTILDVNRRFAVTSADRVLALSSLSFDLSVYDVFGTLAAGGTIVLPSPSGVRDPAHWAELVHRERVTIWNSVPALMDLLVEYAAGRPEPLLGSLRLVLLSGDWIPVNLPDRVRALAPHGRVISLGGATEASIWSVLYPIEEVDPAWKSIPYGRAMGNQQVHVLDDALEPRPVWVPGELYIGGIGLAQGYWRDPAKTAASFITHPRTGGRLYRTGDYGRYLPDGNIEFLGREDLQVKIQGYRVELGEIEAALVRHPGVQAAVVAARGEARGEKRLVAYLVPKADPLSSEDVRRWARDKLPEHMVPTAVVMLDELPLSPNSKVDRTKLPEPGAERAETPVTLRPEEAELRAKMAGIVAGVLKLEDVEPGTDLLTLGATSMDIIRIANRLDSELGFRPSIEKFYRVPTVDGLVALHRQQREQAEAPEASEPAPSTAVPDDVLASFDLLLDPEERRAFKEGVPGLRRFGDIPRQVPLHRPRGNETIKARYAQRRSHRQFLSEPVPFEKLSSLLSNLGQLQIDGKPKYLYASAGGLYPVQTYLYAKRDRVENLAEGVYYYRPTDHTLALLSAGAEIDRYIYDPFVNGPIFDQAAFSLFFIVQLAAIVPMYGNRSMHFAAIEAGLMAQLLEMSAPSCGIGLCQIGNLDFDRIRRFFVLEETHALVHSLLGGLIDTRRLGTWSPFDEAYYAPHAADDEREEIEL